MTPPQRRASRIWTVPLVLAILVSGSLLAALIADGVWDVLASIAMGCVVLYALGMGVASGRDR